MVTSQQAPTVASPATDSYGAYQFVAQLVSKRFADAITQVFDDLAGKDEKSFVAEVQKMAQEQGAGLSIPPDVFASFWSLANGFEADLRWRSSSGVPARSSLIADAVAKPDSTARTDGGQQAFSIGVSAFGVGIGVSW